MSKLKVTFEDPEAGWIWIHLQSATQSVNVDASYIHSGLFPLVDALYRMYLAPGEETVVWHSEPGETDMRFRRRGNVVHLDVLGFPDSRRSVFSEPEPDLSVSGTYDEVCLPFWRALRHLQGRLSEQEFATRWHGPFPTEELAQLTRTLGK